jgi:hypothetical protein
MISGSSKRHNGRTRTYRQSSSGQLAVGARTGQPQGVGFGFALDRQQIGPDVTLTVARPITAQVMNAVRLILGQSHENGHQVHVKRRPLAALAFPFVVRLERG